MNPGATGGVPMIPPSTKLASLTIPAASRAVPGATALASTYTPPNPVPATARATSSAPCGGHTDTIISERPARSASEAAAVSPAASARAALAGLRPAASQSTSCPAAVRHCPTAAPISPGCSSPIVVSLMSPLSPGAVGVVLQRPVPGRRRHDDPCLPRTPNPLPLELPGARGHSEAM